MIVKPAVQARLRPFGPTVSAKPRKIKPGAPPFPRSSGVFRVRKSHNPTSGGLVKWRSSPRHGQAEPRQTPLRLPPPHPAPSRRRQNKGAAPLTAWMPLYVPCSRLVVITAESPAPMTVWPSSLRRWLKAPFRKGAGSNSTAVILPCEHAHPFSSLRARRNFPRFAPTAFQALHPGPYKGMHQQTR